MSDAALLPYNHSRSTSPAVSRRGRASRMPTRCAPSLPPCGALTRRQSEQEIMSYDYPDPKGHFGPYGGQFVAETLMGPLRELLDAYLRLKNDPVFLEELDRDLADYVGRPSPLYHAERLTKAWGGAEVWLKREDLNHTGAHKVNNTVGQALLAKHLGKTRIIAETGAGQQGVAAATNAARAGLERKSGGEGGRGSGRGAIGGRR